MLNVTNRPSGGRPVPERGAPESAATVPGIVDPLGFSRLMRSMRLRAANDDHRHEGEHDPATTAAAGAAA
jgi:hypothetical protein